MIHQPLHTIVLGLGGIGSGALYWLSRKLHGSVLGIEQFGIGHRFGSSQDHSRIIRLSYHRPEYVNYAKAAYQAWAIVENEADEQLVFKCGGLDFSGTQSALPLSDYIESLKVCNVPHEVLDGAEIMKRWPQFNLTEGEYIGLYQDQGGLVAAAKANAAHIRLAELNGAKIVTNTPVSAINQQGSEIEVVADGIPYRCQKLVLTGGSWTNRLLSYFNMKLPLTVTQEQVTYIEPQNLEQFMPGRFPIWIWMDYPSYYGFPVFGEPAVKVGQDVGGDSVLPETRTFEPNPKVLQRSMEFMNRYLPSAVGKIRFTKTCLYTLTPDRDFIIDYLPQNPSVVMAVGAGHAFKFASVIGKTLTDLVLNGGTDYDLSLFRITRSILQEENPACHFVI